MLSISGILTGCFFSFFFITQLLEFSATSKREREGQLIFPGVMWLRGVYLLSHPDGIHDNGGMYKEGDPDWTLLFCLFVLCSSDFSAGQGQFKLPSSRSANGALANSEKNHQ
jgi:hypothetical protein